jgi:polar amino acid transport system substrate-binding protein
MPAGSPIPLHYEERPPYLVRAGDGVHGLTADPAARIFRAAGVPFVWEASSMSRQLHLMRENQAPLCAVGWFKTAERLAFAKFTRPIYRDGPVVALARRQFAFGPGRAMADVLSTPGLRVLVRGRYAYGPYIERALERATPDVIASPLPNVQLAERLVANRADLMFAPEEEAALLLLRLADKAAALQVLRFSDRVPGSERYIACSRSVPDDTITRLNGAIGFK